MNAAKKVCYNCNTTFLSAQRKCANCKATVRFARCETVEEQTARETKDDAVEEMLQKILNGLGL